MTAIRYLLIPLIVALFSGCMHTRETALFDAADPATFLVHPPEAAEAFVFEDGVLKVAGQPFSYIRTTKAHSNYRLTLEWRWLEGKGNSGVFLHIKDDDETFRVFPSCFEAQLASGKAGTVFLVGEGMAATARDQKYLVPEGAERPIKGIRMLEETNENEPGEWNLYEITVRGDTLELKVNGLLQNNATELSRSSGYVGLQAEGAPLEFRKVRLEPLD